VTAVLNVHLKIMDLLASILMMIAMYSINLRIMGRPNIPLIMEPTMFSILQPEWLADYIARPLILMVIVLLAKFLLDAYFSTRQGLAIRATVSNPRMSDALGVNPGDLVLLGMAITNALGGHAGARYEQAQGGADISMGIGTIVIGLAAVIIGESIIPARRIVYLTLAVVIGAVIYRFFIALALNSDFIGLQAQDLNLITAVLVVIALVIPLLKQRLTRRRQI